MDDSQLNKTKVPIISDSPPDIPRINDSKPDSAETIEIVSAVKETEPSPAVEVKNVPSEHKSVGNKRATVMSRDPRVVQQSSEPIYNITPIHFKEIGSGEDQNQEYEMKLFETVSEAYDIIPAFHFIGNDTNVLNQVTRISDLRSELESLSVIRDEMGDFIFDSSQKMFSLGCPYIFFELNPEFFEGSRLSFKNGVPMSQSLFAELASSNMKSILSPEKFEIVSGMIVSSIFFSLKTQQVLKVSNSTNACEIASCASLRGHVDELINRKFLKPIRPHPFLAAGHTGLKMLDHFFKHVANGAQFKYGRYEILSKTDQGGPIVEDSYINIDQVTAIALGITAQQLFRDRFDRQLVVFGLEAYSLEGSDVQIIMNEAELRHYGIRYSKEQELSALLMACALSPEIEKMILETNIQTFLSFNTVKPRTTNDVLGSIVSDNINEPVLRRIKERRNQCDWNTAIKYLVMQSGTMLTWPNIVEINVGSSSLSLVVDLIEVALWFIFYPTLSKYIGAGLANRIYRLVDALNPTEYMNFVQEYGHDGTPGSEVRITDIDYWSNNIVPPIYDSKRGFNRRKYPVFSFIRDIIHYQYSQIDHKYAIRANFPRVAKSSVHYEHYGFPPDLRTTQQGIVSTRIRAMLTECLKLVHMLNAGGAVKNLFLSSNKISSLQHIFAPIRNHVEFHGTGFSREIGRPLAYLRNRKTNFLPCMNTPIGDPFPKELIIASETAGEQRPFLWIENRRGNQEILQLGAVWTLLLDLDFPGLSMQSEMKEESFAFYEAPNPGEEWSKDEAILKTCFDLSIPMGITSRLIEASDVDRCFQRLWTMAGVKVRDRSFERLMRQVQDQCSNFKINPSVNKDVQYGDDTKKFSCYNPCVRIFDGGVALPIDPNDSYFNHSITQLDLIPPGFFERFRAFLVAIGDPSSDMYKLKKGLYLYRKSCVTESPSDTILGEIAGLKRIVYSRNLFQNVRSSGGSQLVISLDGDIYNQTSSSIPKVMIIIPEPYQLRAEERNFLYFLLAEGKVCISLPNQYYIPSITCIDSGHRPDDFALAKHLLEISDSKVPVITFFDSEIVMNTSYSDSRRVSDTLKVVWPAQSLLNNLVFKSLTSENAELPDTFDHAPLRSFDSGFITRGGALTYSGGDAKDVRSMCYSNGVICFTDRARLDGIIRYIYSPPLDTELFDRRS